MAETNNTQLAAPQQLTPAQQTIKKFQTIINGSYFQKQIEDVLGENKGQFTTSLMEVFTNDKALHACDPKQVAQEAIKACCMGLNLSKQLGYAYLIPFKNTPTLVLGFKGLMKLANNTGKYETINADIVYEGELRARNKLTGKLDIDGERTGDRVEGFFAYYKLHDRFGGGSHTLYMTTREMAHYAKTYSPTLKADKCTENDLVNLINEQAVKGPKGGVGWKNDIIAMSIKTVIRRLLTKWGDLSISEKAYAALTTDELPSAEQIRLEANDSPKPVFDAADYAEAQEISAEEADNNPFK